VIFKKKLLEKLWKWAFATSTAHSCDPYPIVKTLSSNAC